MRLVKSVFLISVILSFFAPVSLAKGDGTITDVQVFNVPPLIKVFVQTSDRRDYVGLTVDSNDDGEFGLDDLNLSAQRVKGRSCATFNLPIDPTLGGKKFIVSLWDDRIENCGNCRWCKKYGYHLEGRLDSHYGEVKHNPFMTP